MLRGPVSDEGPVGDGGSPAPATEVLSLSRLEHSGTHQRDTLVKRVRQLEAGKEKEISPELRDLQRVCEATLSLELKASEHGKNGHLNFASHRDREKEPKKAEVTTKTKKKGKKAKEETKKEPFTAIETDSDVLVLSVKFEGENPRSTELQPGWNHWLVPLVPELAYYSTCHRGDGLSMLNATHIQDWKGDGARLLKAFAPKPFNKAVEGDTTRLKKLLTLWMNTKKDKADQRLIGKREQNETKEQTQERKAKKARTATAAAAQGVATKAARKQERSEGGAPTSGAPAEAGAILPPRDAAQPAVSATAEEEKRREEQTPLRERVRAYVDKDIPGLSPQMRDVHVEIQLEHIKTHADMDRTERMRALNKGWIAADDARIAREEEAATRKRKAEEEKEGRQGGPKSRGPSA